MHINVHVHECLHRTPLLSIEHNTPQPLKPEHPNTSLSSLMYTSRPPSHQSNPPTDPPPHTHTSFWFVFLMFEAIWLLSFSLSQTSTSTITRSTCVYVCVGERESVCVGVREVVSLLKP